jgi:hypothetical protein
MKIRNYYAIAAKFRSNAGPMKNKNEKRNSNKVDMYSEKCVLCFQYYLIDEGTNCNVCQACEKKQEQIINGTK